MTFITWDVKGRTPIGEPIHGYDGELWSIAYSPDGTTLAAGG